MLDDLIHNIAKQQAQSRDNILVTALETLGVSVSDALDAKNPRRGQVLVYPDKREVFVWDGIPLIEFFPMTMRQELGPDGSVKIVVDQKYKVLLKGGEDV